MVSLTRTDVMVSQLKKLMVSIIFVTMDLGNQTIKTHDQEENYENMHKELEVYLELDEPRLLGDTINGFGTMTEVYKIVICLSYNVGIN